MPDSHLLRSVDRQVTPNSGEIACFGIRGCSRLHIARVVGILQDWPVLAGKIRYFAGGGNSATSRSETVNSSSWKCGRRNATAL
jgi:hypothetical protein